MRLLLIALLLPAAAVAGEGMKQMTPAEMEAALDRPVTLEAGEETLTNSLELLAKQANCSILIDAPSLADEGVSPDEPIERRQTVTLPLRSMAKLLLSKLGLTLSPDASTGTLVVLSSSDAAAIRTTVFYDVSDLAKAGLVESPQAWHGGGASGVGFDAEAIEQLAEALDRIAEADAAASEVPDPDKADAAFAESIVSLVQNHTEGPWEAVSGEGGVVSVFGTPDKTLLVILAEHRTHAEVRQLLDQLRDALGVTAGEPEARE